MKKSVVVAAASAAISVGACVLNAAPALADSRSYGAKSCVQGSLYTEARGNQTVRHEHLRNGTVRGKSFVNGATYQTDRYYPLISVEDRATIQNGVGTITSASRNCSD